MAKYALCMGVNNYANWRALGWNASDLPYSVKNAEDFAQVLIDGFGFDPANVGIQRDAWCTRGNILHAINDLLQRAHAGDVVCVLYSGHGSRIQGVAPGGQPEQDVWYEAIVPFSGALITDYDLAVLADQLEYDHINLNFILDTCHSGGMAPIEGAPHPVGIPLSDQGAQIFRQFCRTLVPYGLCVEEPRTALSGNIQSVRMDDGHFVIDWPEDRHYTTLAKSTLLSACAAEQFGWQVPALQSSILVGAMKNVVNQSGFQSSYSAFLDQVRTQAGILMAQHVQSIPSYASMQSVPQLYGQRARMSEMVLAPWSFSIQG